MNPLLIEIPIQFETERLLLRVPKEVEDSILVNRAVKDSVSELKPWLPFAQEIPTVEETKVNLREANIKFLKRESIRYLIFHKDTNEFIGVTSLENVDWKVPKCNIGYWIATKHSGKGYMVEAVKGLTELGFHQLHFMRIEIRCESSNLKSRAIPERLGYKLEGVLENEDLSADGSKLTDTCVYAKVQKII